MVPKMTPNILGYCWKNNRELWEIAKSFYNSIYDRFSFVKCGNDHVQELNRSSRHNALLLTDRANAAIRDIL